jgi:peptidoglycan LD-endopeptidase LytH
MTSVLVGLSLVALCAIAFGVLLAGGQTGTATASTDLHSAQPHPTVTVPATVPAHHVFPVVGRVSYAHTHLTYPATDVIAACGSPVRSVVNGIVLELSRTDSYDPAVDDGATRGGLFVSVLGDDGVRYYGSHLSAVATALAAGDRVRAGQIIGAVGHTGHAGVCHLHFGISPPCGRVGDWWVRRGVIWPWSYLDSWRTGGELSPVAEVASWQRKHGCPTAP